MPQQPPLTADEQKLNDLWNEHLRAEFSAHSADEAIATMVANPLVNQVPVMIGGDGKEELDEFYAKHFLPQIPPDMEMVPVSRTIGQGRLVDEVVARFTHTIPMDWMLPGIPPTGKRVEVALVVVVQFDGDKMAHEYRLLPTTEDKCTSCSSTTSAPISYSVVRSSETIISLLLGGQLRPVSCFWPVR